MRQDALRVLRLKLTIARVMAPMCLSFNAHSMTRLFKESESLSASIRSQKCQFASVQCNVPNEEDPYDRLSKDLTSEFHCAAPTVKQA